jgi:peptidoglycan hydrolase-like protein with peptidoglycan-binding domain
MKAGLNIVCICLVSAISAFGDQAIADVQRALKEQGFYYGEITGQKDADTTAAIRRYQIRNGLQITGELNDETLRSIRSTASNSSVSPPIARNDVPSAPAGPPDTSDLRVEPSPADREMNQPPIQSFEPGANRNDARPAAVGQGLFAGTPYETAPIPVQRRVIADAQRILARRGLFKDQVDGSYGPNLEFSLRAYQSRVGLATTGRLDLETLAALQLLPGAHAPIFTPRRPIAVPPPVRGEWVHPGT